MALEELSGVRPIASYFTPSVRPNLRFEQQEDTETPERSTYAVQRCLDRGGVVCEIGGPEPFQEELDLDEIIVLRDQITPPWTNLYEEDEHMREKSRIW